MSESKLQGKCIELLKALPCYYIKTMISSRMGTPDLIICTNKGKFIAIEFKANAKSIVSPLQKHNIKLINSLNGCATVIYNFETFKALMGELFND